MQGMDGGLIRCSDVKVTWVFSKLSLSSVCFSSEHVSESLTSL